MSYIPIEKCEHGYLYRVISRRFFLDLGVYDAKSCSFAGLSSECGMDGVSWELHYDKDSKYGTVQPLEKLVKCPFDVNYSLEDEDNNELLNWLNKFIK